jgi:3-phosphoshikimate 1-carboxyvinyltransferase
MSALSATVTEDWRCSPASSLQGHVQVPGDKSITQRALILSSIAAGTSQVTGALDAEDCRSTVTALRALGARIAGSGTQLEIMGGSLHAPASPLDLGNSGTGLRLLTGLLAGQPFCATLTGDASLRRRPMQRVAEPLRRMGATIETAAGCPPVTVTGRPLRGIDYTLPIASAQVKSAILLAALSARGTTCVREPGPSRDHTERLLPAMGCALRMDAGGIAVDGPVRLHASPIAVPGDFSSAAFFLVAASICPDSALVLSGVGVNPTRTGLLDALRAMGARIEQRNVREEGGEPVGDLHVGSAELHGTELDAALVPRLIDELPVLFVAAAVARGRTRVRGAAELRAKESDRLATMAAGLRTLGVAVEEFPDGLDIDGGRIGCGSVASQGDHRVAMAFAVAAQVASGPVLVIDTANVATSFPGFAELARGVGFGLEPLVAGARQCLRP